MAKIQVLEEKALDAGKQANIVFEEGDKMRLVRGYEEGRFFVDIVMPWSGMNMYNLYEGSDRTAAQVKFEEYFNKLHHGNDDFGIRIISSRKAQIVEVYKSGIKRK